MEYLTYNPWLFPGYAPPACGSACPSKSNPSPNVADQLVETYPSCHHVCLTSTRAFLTRWEILTRQQRSRHHRRHPYFSRCNLYAKFIGDGIGRNPLDDGVASLCVENSPLFSTSHTLTTEISVYSADQRASPILSDLYKKIEAPDCASALVTPLVFFYNNVDGDRSRVSAPILR